MSIDWTTDPMLADFVRRCRQGERMVDETDLEADRREAQKARNRECSRLSHAKRRARLKAKENGTIR
ncbi:hypothetical protein [Bifidobacterium phasiani]|uniref:Uncharacterized protein n=1 Tax=Bifidobacterium phasiani TaxID=2834431 RepID=A0ABS6W662_9BIFI|nr:hypothetical protein [Bifidobacterium phasiani]MBW3081985.1 hypothetical protein [Bifidobacterium phasiani]